MTDFSVAATLDAHIRRLEVPREPDGMWHPSGLFSCERSAVYEIRGTLPSDERTSRSRGILRQGTNLHTLVQEAMTQESGADAVYHEVEVSIPGLGVYGHCDTLLEFADGTFELDEFKSISPNGMKYGGLPKPEHVEQARTYAYGLRTVGGYRHGPRCDGDHDPLVQMARFERDEPGCYLIPPLGDRLRRIRLAYFNRDDLTVEEFVLFPSDEWETGFRQKIARLDRYKQDGEALPPRLPLDAKGKKNWLCAGYCQFRSLCWDKDGEGEEL